MSFGRFFKRGSDATANLIAEPRTHHYQFAHRFLPAVARQQGMALLGAFADEDADETLCSMWAWLGEKLPEENRLVPDGLDVSLRRHGEYVIALFTFPVPQAATEVYFTALAFGPLATDEAEEQSPPMRYFTLEYGFSLNAHEKRTVLGEWAYKEESVSHLNMGTGPDPDAEAFFNRVCVLLG